MPGRLGPLSRAGVVAAGHTEVMPANLVNPGPSSPFRPTYPLRTRRLDLRPHRRDDLDDLLAFHSRPEVTRYIPWPVRDREQTRLALEAKLSQTELTAPGQWLVLAVELRATSTVIGEVLLKWESEQHRQGEVGYAFHPDHQGQGLAGEAVIAMLDLGFGDLGLRRIIGSVVAGNAASQRLLTRLGMRHEATMVDALYWDGAWTDDELYAITEPEWRERGRGRAPSL